jgi:hypothetical protein
MSELPPLETTLCLRFLRAYLASSGDRTDWKSIWRALERVSAQRAKRQRRKAA